MLPLRVPGPGISIHAPREGSDLTVFHLWLEMDISIHAPREGSDVVRVGHEADGHDFNPRSP